jgi:hypothetical protein
MMTAVTVLAYVIAGGFAIGALMFFVALLAEVSDPDRDGRAPFEHHVPKGSAWSSGKAARGPEAFDAARAEMQARLRRIQR